MSATAAQAVDFLTFETGPVRPVATSDDGSTGTQCKAHYYPQEGRTYRVRIFREEAMRTVESYGRSVSGSVWTVTVQDMDDPDRPKDAAPRHNYSWFIWKKNYRLDGTGRMLPHEARVLVVPT